MADWIGKARSNYFRVKDKEAFLQWANAIGDLDVIEDDEGRVGLLSSNHYGGWPESRWDDQEEDYVDLDVVDEVTGHLQDGSVAVLVEIGAEKLRYLTGRATAVNSKGDCVRLNLNNIYDLARHLGDELTDVSG